MACIVRLGALLPFEQVPELLALLTGVQLSVDTVRRITERAGSAQVAIDEQALTHLEQDLPTTPVGAAARQVSADGAMVPLVGGAWTEVRTVAIGTRAGGGEEAPGHANAITYFSRHCSAHEFIRQSALPCHERGTAAATAVVAVMDGAEWLQEFIDTHCPDAVRILDFPHAVEYLAKVAHTAFGTGSRDAAVWLDEWAPRLKREGPDRVLQAIRQLPMPDVDAQVVQAQELGYLMKRRPQLQYGQFQAAGYPIGSGMVESANKLVVEARLKGSPVPRGGSRLGVTGHQRTCLRCSPSAASSVVIAGTKRGLLSGENSGRRRRCGGDCGERSGRWPCRRRGKTKHPPRHRIDHP